MPARLIRDGILESEAVLCLPVEARWLYVTVLLSADDVGLFEATPFRLARRADVRREMADKLLEMLVDTDLVRLYEHGGKRYGFIPRFGQRLQIKRARCPLPPLELLQDDDDALKKIKHLASNPTVDSGGSRNSTAGQRPEPEPEPEPEKEKRNPSGSLSTPKAPTPKEKRAAKKCPAEFAVTAEMLDWAREEHPLVDTKLETAIFRDHTFATARTDWVGTWKNWVRKAAKEAAARAQRRPAADQRSEARRHFIDATTGGRGLARTGFDLPLIQEVRDE